MHVSDTDIRDEMRRLAKLRTRKRTFCPSEVARALAQDWRPLMDRVREVARQEAQAGSIAVLQKGKLVDITVARGPIRLRQA
jgi:hypothetical protein